MKRFLLVFALFLSVAGTATANGFDDGINDVIKSRSNNDPFLSKKNGQTNTLRVADFNCTIDRSKTYTLPVVVHVIQPSASNQLISNAQIIAAVNAMSDRFGGRLGGTLDTKIQFALATTDQYGNATTGITRNDASGVPKYTMFGVSTNDTIGAYDQDVKILNVWPRDRYINIWVFNRVNGKAGYSDGLSTYELEGIGIEWGHMSALSTVLTHEMGHVFNLLHVFEGADEFSCAANGNCHIDGDGCCDTPPIGLNCTMCSSYPDSANSKNNYLSYCSGDRSIFTPDQVRRMREALFGIARATLISSTGLGSATTAIEGGIDSVTYNDDFSVLLCNHQAHPSIRFTNYGTSDLDSVTIIATVSGIQQTPFIFRQHIASHTTVMIPLPAITFATEGSYDLSFKVTKFNALSSDAKLENNTICSQVYALIGNANVTAVASPPIGGTVTGSKTFTCDGNDTLNAVEKTGYNFTGWYDDGILMTTNRQVIVPIEVWRGNQQFVAQFSKKIYSVSLTVNPANTGTITGSATGNYPYQTVITSTAKVNAGYKFVHWKKDGVIYQTDSVLSVSVLDNANYVAVFTIVTGIKQNTLTDLFNVYPNPTNGTLFVNLTTSHELSGTLSVMNMIGEELQVQSVSGSSAFQFNLDQLAKGSYFLLYKDDQGNVSTYKFVLQ